MKDWKGINYKVIIKVIGFLLLIEGVFMFAGLPFSVYYEEQESLAILFSGLITMLTGGILWFSTRNNPKNTGRKEGYVIVAITWIIISLFGTLPFILSGAMHILKPCRVLQQPGQPSSPTSNPCPRGSYSGEA